MVGLKLKIPISAIYLNKNVVRAAQVTYDKERVKHHHEAELLENQMLQAYLDYKLAKEEQTVRLKKRRSRQRECTHHKKIGISNPLLS